MRKRIVAGNWKMNKTIHEAILLADNVVSQIAKATQPNVTVIIAPPFPYLQQVYHLTEKAMNVFTAAQNCSFEEKGAFTGEVSANMIYSTGTKYVIIGHSERRNILNESNIQIKGKIDQAIKGGLTPIFCCGETKNERENNAFKDVLQKQLKESLFHLTKEDIIKTIIAYEPVWAIGTGLSATPEQAQEVHSFIRSVLGDKYDEETASSISILYGGSCNSANAKDLFSQKDIDGGLIGGASLDPTEFNIIINSFPAKAE